MNLSRPALVAFVSTAGICMSAAPAVAEEYSDATTYATGLSVERIGTVDEHGGARIDLTVQCAEEGTVSGVLVTVEQRHRGQVTQGFTDWYATPIPCSPEGTEYTLGLEVFGDVYFRPGTAVVTEATVDGVDENGDGVSTDFPTGQRILLRSSR
ncbi:hypothetical protein [Modestobacter sp. URMC 112]